MGIVLGRLTAYVVWGGEGDYFFPRMEKRFIRDNDTLLHHTEKINKMEASLVSCFVLRVPTFAFGNVKTKMSPFARPPILRKPK